MSPGLPQAQRYKRGSRGPQRFLRLGGFGPLGLMALCWHGFGGFGFKVEGIRAKVQGLGVLTLQSSFRPAPQSWVKKRACGGQVAAHARSYRFKKRVTRRCRKSRATPHTPSSWRFQQHYILAEGCPLRPQLETQNPRHPNITELAPNQMLAE